MTREEGITEKEGILRLYNTKEQPEGNRRIKAQIAAIENLSGAMDAATKASLHNSKLTLQKRKMPYRKQRTSIPIRYR